METKATDQSDIPSVHSALADGWRVMKANFLVFFLAIIVLTVAEVPINMGQGWNVDVSTNGNEITINDELVFNEDGELIEGDPENLDVSAMNFWILLVFAYQVLVIPTFKYGADLIFLKGARGEKADVKDILKGFDKYVNVILSSLLVFGLVLVSFVFFIIPGIYVACRVCFVAYLVMDEDLDPVEAVEASWRLTAGHTLKILLLGLSCCFISLLGLILLGVGFIPALMWCKASFAEMYLSIVDNSDDEQAAEVAIAA